MNTCYTSFREQVRPRRNAVIKLLSTTLPAFFFLLFLGISCAYAGPADGAARWLLEKIDEALPGTLSFEKIDASFTGPIIVEKLDYQGDQTEFSAGRLEIDWSLSAMLKLTAKINLIHASDVVIRLPEFAPAAEPAQAAEPLALSDIKLPVDIEIEQLDISNVRIFQANADTPTVIDQVKLQVKTQDDTILLSNFTFRAFESEIVVAGQIKPIGDYPLEFTIDSRHRGESLGPIDGRTEIKGSVGGELVLNQTISGTVASELDARVSQVMQNPDWQAALTIDIPDLGKLSSDLSGAALTAKLASQGTLSDYQASGDFNTSAIAQVGAIDGGFALNGGVDRIAINRLELRAADSPLTLDVQADIDLAAQTLRGKGAWRDLAWPLSGQPEIELPSGQFDLSGTLQNYRFTLDTVIRGAAFGTLNTRIIASGDKQQLAISTLDVSAAANELRLSASGDFGFAEQRFNLNGGWQQLSLPLVGQAQFKSPSGSFNARGTPQQYAAQLDAVLNTDLAGDVNASIDISGSEQAVQINTMTLKSPGGDLDLDVSAQYHLGEQRFQAKGSWRQLAWPLLGEPQIKSASGSFDAAGTVQDFQAQLQAAITGSQIGALDTRARLAGSEQGIQLTELAVNAPDSDLAMTINGAFDPETQRFDATGEWQALRWPLTGTAQINSPSGTFSAQGTPQDYQAELQAVLSSDQFGNADAAIEVKGSEQLVQLPLLRLQAAQGELSLNIKGEYDLAAERFAADGEWRALAWPLTGQPQIESPAGSFSAQGSLARYQARLNATLISANTGSLDIELNGEGSDQVLQNATLIVSAPERDLMLRAGGRLAFADLSFDATGSWRALAWPLVGQAQIESPDGEFSARGSPDDYRFQLEASLLGPQRQTLTALVRADGNNQRIQLAQFSLKSPQNGPSLDAKGTLALADLSFQGDGRWQNLVWPLSGQPQIELPGGSFQLDGNMQNYTFQLDSEVRGPAIPPGNWVLQGSGSDQALNQTTLKAQILDGEIDGTLSARWQPQLSWQAELSAKAINPGTFWPQMPGVIDLQASSTGQTENGQVIASATLQRFAGELRQQKLQGEGKVTVAGDTITLEEVRLQAGEARIQASGVLAERWNVDWLLDIPRLERLVPDAGGAVTGSGSLSGTAAQPQAAFDIAIDELRYASERIRRLRAQGEIDLSGAKQSQIKASASALQLGGRAWKTFELEGSGAPSQHQVQAELDGEDGRFGLSLNGALADTAWRGQLTRLSANNTIAGNWTLSKPVPISASAQQARLDRLCLSNNPAQVCIQAAWDARTGSEARLSIAKLTTKPFARFLPENLTVQTSLDGDATASVGANGAVQAQLELRLKPGSINTVVSGNRIDIGIQGGRLSADIKNNNAAGKLDIDLGKLGRINAAVQISDMQSAQRLGGDVKADIDDLSLVSAFVPQVQSVQGKITARASLGGTLPAPEIKGAAQLLGAGADVPQVNVSIRNGQVRVSGGNNERIKVSGSLQSGDGRIDISSELESIDNLAVQITGRNFVVSDTPEIRVLADPDLQVSLAQNALRIEGDIGIPEARLSPPETGPSTVSVSDDAVIIRDAKGNKPNPEQPINIFAKIRIILGQDVRVQAAGLDAKLDGSLLVEQTPVLAPRGSGRIQIERGEYKIYGQALNIERGSLLFSGSPLNNPGLDLRVERQAGDVTAGATITGTAQNPRLTLFSVPALPDSSIMSYILFGRPPDSASGSEQAMLLGAAAGVAAGKLQPVLPLDQLSVESSDGDPDNSSLFVGKYLTPDLFISYGIGLFEAVNTLKMRYQINKRLSVESTNTSTGNSGVDLIFTIER